MDATDEKLRLLQSRLCDMFGMKLDLYRQEGKGVLAVPHGFTLKPSHVIYTLSDSDFLKL